MAVQSPPPTISLRDRRRSIAASTVGNVLEWYEWSAYAVFTPFIAAAMFDTDDPVAGILSTLAVFAVGFLMRPLGGIVFGRIADRRGRKFVLITTMLIMAAGSAGIAVLPGHSSIGIGAAIILLLIRVAQGFAHGGEAATANSYTAEIAPRERRGLWSAAAFLAIFGGSAIAYTVGAIITTVFSKSAVGDWAWRLPFVLGALLALVALWMRTGMKESDVFDDAEQAAKDIAAAQAGPTDGAADGAADRARIIRSILLVVFLTSGLTAAHYTWSSYVSTLAIKGKGMEAYQAYWALAAAQLIAIVFLPVWGALSDRIGRRPLLIMSTLGVAVIQYPLITMISDEGWSLFVASTVALCIVGMAGSILAAVLSEAFPTRIRTQGIGFAYSISVAVFGGTAPYLNQLFNSLDMSWLSSGYVIVLCLFSATAAWLLPETKGVDLTKV